MRVRWSGDAEWHRLRARTVASAAAAFASKTDGRPDDGALIDEVEVDDSGTVWRVDVGRERRGRWLPGHAERVVGPVPLAAPDGTVYAYACGRCHRVGMADLVSLKAADVRAMAEASRGRAKGCCVCSRCGTAGDYWPRICPVCDSCIDAEKGGET